MTNTNSPHSSSTAGLTTTQATTSLIKGIIGAGTFSMPWAFRQSGLLAGIIVVFILALWSAHTIKVRNHNEVCLFDLYPVLFSHLLCSSVSLPLVISLYQTFDFNFT